MKTKIIILIGCFLLIISLNPLKAQTIQKSEIAEVPSLFVGVGMGINDYGLGGGVETTVLKNIALYGNVGIGGWGWKLGGGLNFYTRKLFYKSCISIGYVLARGINDVSQDLAVEPYGEMQTVTLDYNPVSTINFIYSYNFKLGRKFKLVVSSGWAIPITDNPYEVKTPGVTLSQSSELLMNFIEPGGLIMGVKFMAGR